MKSKQKYFTINSDAETLFALREFVIVSHMTIKGIVNEAVKEYIANKTHDQIKARR